MYNFSKHTITLHFAIALDTLTWFHLATLFLLLSSPWGKIKSESTTCWSPNGQSHANSWRFKSMYVFPCLSQKNTAYYYMAGYNLPKYKKCYNTIQLNIY